MLDKKIVPLLKPPLKKCAQLVHGKGISADFVTVFGFVIGVACIVALAFEQYELALALLLLNRLADGIDGELARLQTATDAGGFLDITLDFIFYALFPLGFAFANVEQNALPAAVLIASFVGTGASFLAFSSLANNAGIEHPEFAYKSLYYLDGLAEGTETILCFAIMCLFPMYFAVIAWIFAAVCLVTAINRVLMGYATLRRNQKA
jgi:CDP-diacylglycerol--glycerol-3-phosphate 3-phosphatidyltransferase